MWMHAILPAAIGQFHQTCPGVELKLSTASFAEGLRRLADGDSDLHCGAVDAGAPLPRFLRREHVLDITAGIVAGEGHPLLAARPAVGDLVGYPWIDYGGPEPPGTAARTSPSSLPTVLDGAVSFVHRKAGSDPRAALADTGRAVLLSELAAAARCGSPGLPYQTRGRSLRQAGWPQLRRFRPPAAQRVRYETVTPGTCLMHQPGAPSNRQDLTPFRLLEETVRETALDRSSRSPDRNVR